MIPTLIIYIYKENVSFPTWVSYSSIKVESFATFKTFFLKKRKKDVREMTQR